jgi:hypothetical protein
VTAEAWHSHPLMAAFTKRQQLTIIDLLNTSLSCEAISTRSGVEAAVVEKIRRERNLERRRAYSAQSRRSRAKPQPPKMAKPRLNKPCECGREGCLVVQHATEIVGRFQGRRFASIECWDYWKKARGMPAVPKPEPKLAPLCPSPETFVAILARHHPYAQGEPTRETVHGWASSHSGKRELSTAQVAALRAPTVVCTVSMLEGLA